MASLFGDAVEDLNKSVRLLSPREDILVANRNVGHTLNTLHFRPLNLVLDFLDTLIRGQELLNLTTVQPNLDRRVNQRRDLATLVLLKVVSEQLLNYLILLATRGSIVDQAVGIQSVDDAAVVAEVDAFLMTYLDHPVADQGCAGGAKLAGVHVHLLDGDSRGRGVELVGVPVDLELNVLVLGCCLECCDCFLLRR